MICFKILWILPHLNYTMDQRTFVFHNLRFCHLNLAWKLWENPLEKSTPVKYSSSEIQIEICSPFKHYLGKYCTSWPKLEKTFLLLMKNSLIVKMGWSDLKPWQSNPKWPEKTKECNKRKRPKNNTTTNNINLNWNPNWIRTNT